MRVSSKDRARAWGNASLTGVVRIVISKEGKNMSWKPEVIADRSGKWAGNGLRFATEQEALDNVRALASKWFMVTETRVVECDEPVNYKWVDGHLEAIPVEIE